MTESDIEAFNDSFGRCMEAGPRFFDIFYDHFLKSSPEVSAKFQGTDFKRQKQMLRVSLYAMVAAAVFRSHDYSTLKLIARHHARTDLEIPPHLYALWLDSLIVAARTCAPFLMLRPRRIGERRCGRESTTSYRSTKTPGSG